MSTHLLLNFHDHLMFRLYEVKHCGRAYIFYSTVILSIPLVSEFFSLLTISLGISEAALSQDTDKVRGQQNLDFRMTISLLSSANRSQFPRPNIMNDRSSTIISILI